MITQVNGSGEVATEGKENIFKSFFTTWGSTSMLFYSFVQVSNVTRTVKKLVLGKMDYTAKTYL